MAFSEQDNMFFWSFHVCYYFQTDEPGWDWWSHLWVAQTLIFWHLL